MNVCICDQPKPDGFSRCKACGLTTVPSNLPVKLVTTKPDAELAEDLKEELVSGAQAWLNACTKAHRAGFVVQAQFGPNYLKEYVIQSLQLVKVF